LEVVWVSAEIKRELCGAWSWICAVTPYILLGYVSAAAKMIQFQVLRTVVCLLVTLFP